MHVGQAERDVPGGQAIGQFAELLGAGDVEVVVAVQHQYHGPGTPRRLLDGLMAIADRAPLAAQTVIPVHADCHWGNWLADGRSVTALLDFEWARFGEPADDWFFLARFSGPHVDIVLDVIAGATATARKTLRAECEVREAAHLASDLRSGLERPGPRAAMIAARLHALEELVDGHFWWRG